MPHIIFIIIIVIIIIMYRKRSFLLMTCIVVQGLLYGPRREAVQGAGAKSFYVP